MLPHDEAEHADTVRSSNGALELGKVLGRGGEGAVY